MSEQLFEKTKEQIELENKLDFFRLGQNYKITVIDEINKIYLERNAENIVMLTHYDMKRLAEIGTVNTITFKVDEKFLRIIVKVKRKYEDCLREVWLHYGK